jgi:hypothetical protein
MTKLISATLLLFIFSCSSYEKYKQVTEELEIPSQVFKSDFNQTWQAVLQVMKKFDNAYLNQESGRIKTRWMDNTLQINFTDSFSGNDTVKSAEFKLMVNVTEGYSYGRKIAKVTIYKRQRLEQDFLQGWKEVSTDGIQEKTLLYRIGILIDNDNKFKEIDDAKEKEQLENF